MKANERDTLIDELLDGSISEADFLKLEAEMRVSPEARRSYYARLKLSDALSIEAESLLEESASETVSFWSTHSRLIASVAAVALFILVGAFGWNVGRQNPSGTDVADSEPVATGYAVLAEQSDVDWGGGLRIDRGDLLPQGSLTMRSGIAQFELFSGVTVIVEGESEFEIRSPMEMKVSKGRIRALVPPAAKGFRVSTASGDVVDLGTEFALDVTSESADMHVLQGEIEWHPASEQKRLLTDGESLRWAVSGEFSESGFRAGSFPSLQEFEQQFASQRLERKRSWNELSTQMSADPRLIAYYPMSDSDGWHRQLRDASPAGLHGTIVSARKAADRWDEPGKALSFSPTGSRVRVVVPGDHNSVTFYCWARIDSLDRTFNSLFLTDGHELNEPHWQIMEDGRLFFSVKRQTGSKTRSDKHIAYSPSFWDPSLSGKWFQIATVYNVDERTTTHYVNGEVISQDRIPDDLFVDTVRIGSASIGNWNEPTREEPSFALRNLNGAIDEFAIFGEALSDDEISELYKMGCP